MDAKVLGIKVRGLEPLLIKSFRSFVFIRVLLIFVSMDTFVVAEDANHNSNTPKDIDVEHYNNRDVGIGDIQYSYSSQENITYVASEALKLADVGSDRYIIYNPFRGDIIIDYMSNSIFSYPFDSCTGCSIDIRLILRDGMKNKTNPGLEKIFTYFTIKNSVWQDYDYTVSNVVSNSFPNSWYIPKQVQE